MSTHTLSKLQSRASSSSNAHVSGRIFLSFVFFTQHCCSAQTHRLCLATCQRCQSQRLKFIQNGCGCLHYGCHSSSGTFHNTDIFVFTQVWFSVLACVPDKGMTSVHEFMSAQETAESLWLISSDGHSLISAPCSSFKDINTRHKSFWFCLFKVCTCWRRYTEGQTPPPNFMKNKSKILYNYMFETQKLQIQI